MPSNVQCGVGNPNRRADAVTVEQIRYALRACRLLVECDEKSRVTGRWEGPDPVLWSEAVRWAREAVGGSA